MRRSLAAVLVLASLLGAPHAPGQPADDPREGYYYPPITSEEHFSRVIGKVPEASRAVRVAFVTQITKAQLAAAEAPRFVIFAKGAEAEHMIIIGLDDQVFRTLYRARALLAQLTSNVRGTKFFLETGIADRATWFDLLRILGFRDLVISDGATWSHRVIFE